MTTFTRQVREETQNIKRTETLVAEINGYEVYVNLGDDERGDIAIYKGGGPDRVGIIRCHPRSVVALERFAADASDLFTAIAASLRAEGVTDLRSSWERMSDEADAKINGYLAARLKP